MAKSPSVRPTIDARSTIKVGTRGSALALAQTRQVIAEIERSTDLLLSVFIIETSGDSGHTAALGDGIFVKEIQRALIEGEIDLAVHSMKDLPTEGPDGIKIAAVPLREDARDALVGSTLQGLNKGAKVGTSSVRRTAQLLRLRPDVEVSPIRGNVPTRISRVRDGHYDAVVVAAAGLRRLGLNANEVLPLEQMLPAPAQGALAVEARIDSPDLTDALASIDHPASRIGAETERALLRTLGGGCLLPIGASATVDVGGITLTAVVCSSDGQRYARAVDTGPIEEQDMIVARVADALKAEGALEILEGS